MNFHLAHIVPNKVMHGLYGYQEVIDTVQWGLRELGHQAEYGLNELSTSATNLVFGAHMLDEAVLNALPPETIVCNFEQMRGMTPEQLKPQLRLAAKRFRVWEYSQANAAVWEMLGTRHLRIVPIGYAPVLQRIERPQLQDIDVLIYGMPGQDRLSAFHYLAMSGLTCVFVCGLYGRARDELIARSKVVLNINVYETSKIFEIVRVSYLLANRKAVLAVVEEGTHIDADMRSAVKVSSPQQVVDDCRALVEGTVARRALEEAGFELMRRRDIRDILRAALAP